MKRRTAKQRRAHAAYMRRYTAARPGYIAWRCMKGRCHNPRNPRFADWGGRGIAVCARWRNSFANFIADVGPPPSPEHTLDRIDNEKGYEPGNVRWATRIEQGQNKRNNRLITFRGETHPITEWARRSGLSRGTLERRLEHGWTPEKALTTHSNRGARSVLA